MKGLDLPIVENAAIRAQVQRKGDRAPEWWGPLLLAGGEWWSIAGRRFHSHEILDWELISVPEAAVGQLIKQQGDRIDAIRLLHLPVVKPQSWAGLGVRLCESCDVVWPCETAQTLGTAS